MKAFSNMPSILRNCFSKIWNKQFLIFIFFLFLSGMFWTFQTLNEVYEEDFIVPLETKGIPGNVVITSDLPKQISIRIRDKGVALLSYRYGKLLPSLTLDHQQHSNPSGHVRLLTAELLKPITDALLPGSQIVGTRPDTIDYYYNYGLHKRVPVKLQGSIRPEKSYYLSQITLSPDSVIVYASKSLLDTITGAYVRPVYFSDVTDTLRRRVEIQSVRGAKFSPSHADLTVIADRMVEKTVQVPVQGVNFPATKVLRTFPSKVNITFQVSMNRYRDITADNFVVVVNYEELIGLQGNTCRLALKSTPDGATRVRIEPEEVEFVIEEVKTATEN